MRKSSKFMATFFHADGTHTSKFMSGFFLDAADAKAHVDALYSEPCTIYCFQVGG